MVSRVVGGPQGISCDCGRAFLRIDRPGILVAPFHNMLLNLVEAKLNGATQIGTGTGQRGDMA